MSPGAVAGGSAAAAHAKLLSDVGAWAGNVSTSVFIVFVNKALMQAFGYHFATTLVRLGWLGGPPASGAAAGRFPPAALARR